jgi:DNA-binding CsgD family transcriptional regulator
MKMRYVPKIKKMIQAMHWFGDFDLSVICFNQDAGYDVQTSFHTINTDGDYRFSNRFEHFIQLVPAGQTRFFMQKQSLWNGEQPLSGHRLIFLKKEVGEVRIFIFHSDVREDVIRLMLHREAVKRMVLYLQENITFNLKSLYDPTLKNLFSVCSVSQKGKCQPYRHQLIEAILASHLTKKEIRYVNAYWLHRSVRLIAQSTGVSRSYINNILLSSAHKLGLERAPDLLALNSSSSVLLQRDSHHAARSYRHQCPEKAAE